MQASLPRVKLTSICRKAAESAEWFLQRLRQRAQPVISSIWNSQPFRLIKRLFQMLGMWQPSPHSKHSEVVLPRPSLQSACPSTAQVMCLSKVATGSISITQKLEQPPGLSAPSSSIEPMPRRGQSQAFLKALRKKYRLGEYQTAGRTLKARQKSRKKAHRLADPRGQWGRSRIVGDRRRERLGM